MSSSPATLLPDTGRSRLGLAGVVALLGIGGVMISVLTRRQFLDPDVYHLLALARLTLEQGWVPMREVFSYTPTIHPTVHHEWGVGYILWWLIQWMGPEGVIALKYALVALTALACLWCSRRWGATWSMLIVLAPLGMLLILIAMSTVRSQMFSLLCLAVLLAFISYDRDGARWWILPWLVMYTMWVNLHGAFIVGMGWLGAYWIEQVVRKGNPQWHLVFAGTAMFGLMFVNPFGWYHPVFIWRAIMLDRPRIDEWEPIWAGKGVEVLLPLYLFAVLLAVYAMYRVGWRRMPGLLILAMCAFAAASHKRHLALFGIAWIGLVPGWLCMTPLGGFFDNVWQRRRWVFAGVAVTIGGASLATLPAKPWDLLVPVTQAHEREFRVVYPFGPVEYLKANEFHGNVMTPFTAGAFVSWQLHPAVKVGMDGRYDAAYPDGLIEELMDMYAGLPEWRKHLEEYPTDLLLTSRLRPIDKLMIEQTDWKLVYRDDTFDMFARPGSQAAAKLPVVDRSGQPLVAVFP